MDKTNTLSIIPDRLTFVGTEGTFDGLINTPSPVLSEDSTRVPTTAWVKDIAEPIIAPSNNLKYWRGDKTWQTLDTSAVPENGNLYFTNARVKNYADTLYVSLTGNYTNPSWIVSLPWTKITGTPTSILGYGITDNIVNTFNTRSGNVMPQAGDYTTSIVAEGSNLYFTNARARSAISVTGAFLSYSSSTGVIGYTYTPENTSNKGIPNGYASLDSGGKVPYTQLPSSIMSYLGVWNASTNSPALSDGTGDTGDTYRVGTSGIQDLGSGAISYTAGDYIIYNGTTWEKSDGTDAVTSVNGAQGVVVITVTGTANRVSVTGGTGITPTIDIASTYVGQSSITTVGTLTSGSIGAGFTAIANARLANSTISGVSLGSNLFGLTIGTGLSGTSYNGSAAVTIANTGVLSITTNTGLSTNASATGAVTITNTGVISAIAGTGVTLSGATGNVTISIGQAVATTSSVTFNTVTATNGGFNSDRNDKENIIYSPSSSIIYLKGASYTRKSSGQLEYGYIAQDVMEYLPEAVYKTDKGWAVSYHMVNAARIDALQKEIEGLKETIKSLQSK